MPDAIRPHDAGSLAAGEPAQSGRRRQVSLAGPDSPARMPNLAHPSALDAELAGRGAGTPESGQVTS
jgi:hypothetical protein